MHRKPIILLVILIASLILTSVPVAYCGYTGLDNKDDVPDSNNIDTGNNIADTILNTIIGILTSIAEVLFDAILKAPFYALQGAWQTVYNALLSWGIAAPLAWAISTLLFIGAFAIGFTLLAFAMDLLGFLQGEED